MVDDNKFYYFLDENYKNKIREKIDKNIECKNIALTTLSSYGNAQPYCDSSG